MRDYVRDIIERKEENVQFIKDNNRWWFECEPYTVDEFNIMVAGGKLEILSSNIKEGINCDAVYRDYSEPILYVFNSKTGEVLTAKFTEKNELYKQWVQVQLELELEDGIVDYKNGKWDVMKHDNIYKKYIEHDKGDIINNRMELIDKYTDEVYKLLMDLDVTARSKYYKQRLQRIDIKMTIHEKELKKIKCIFRFIGAMIPLASVQTFRYNRCDFPLHRCT